MEVCEICELRERDCAGHICETCREVYSGRWVSVLRDVALPDGTVIATCCGAQQLGLQRHSWRLPDGTVIATCCGGGIGDPR